MRLCDFIRTNNAAIIAEWERAARRVTPSTQLSRPALIDHVPRLLFDFADVIGTADEDRAYAETANADTDAHAIERIAQGFQLEDVVRELGLLRACVLRLWRVQHPNVTVDDIDLLSRTIERAIERSVASYLADRGALVDGITQIADAAFDVEHLDEFLDRLIHIFTRFAPSVDSVAILLRDNDRVVVRAAVGLEDEVRQRFALKIGQGFSGTIAARCEPLLLHRACEDPLVVSPIIRARKTLGLFGVPLVDRGTVVGVAHIGTTASEDIPPLERRLFALLSQRATSAIIKHRLREAALRATAQLDAVIEAVPTALFLGDRERVTVANRAGLAMLGIERRDQLRGAYPAIAHALEPRDAVTGDPVPAARLPYGRALNGERLDEKILLRDHRIGEDRVMRIVGGPILDREHVLGAVVLANDITEMQTALDQLRELVDNMPELSWTALPDGQIDFYNRRWYEYTGTTVDRMKGAGWELVHDSEHLPKVAARWKHSLVTGERFEMEFPIRGADGVFRWFLSRAWPLHDSSGKVIRWVGTSTNIDELRRLQRELHSAMDDLQRTAEFRERFIGIVSHDLRNPLTAIAGSASLLIKSPELAPTLAKAAGRIVANVERTSRMVSDLLDFTRGRLGGGIPVEPKPANAAHIVKHVIEDFEQAHPSRRIESTRSGDTSGTWDADRLAQVASNLIGNALTHGARDTPVVVDVEGARDQVVIRVHNDGNPIPPDMLPFIFDPFRRAQCSRIDGFTPAGLGLGLFIACEITRAHQGKIEVESDSDCGTTFTVSLPRTPRAPRA